MRGEPTDVGFQFVIRFFDTVRPALQITQDILGPCHFLRCPKIAQLFYENGAVGQIGQRQHTTDRV